MRSVHEVIISTTMISVFCGSERMLYLELLKETLVTTENGSMLSHLGFGLEFFNS